MKYGDSMLCISPEADIPSAPFCPDVPQLSCSQALVESPQPAHLGCSPTAQLQGHVFACSPGPFPMKQPVCLTSLSRLSLRDWRSFCFLPPTQPFSFWPSLSHDSEMASGPALRSYASFRVHHGRQLYTPQKMTGPLLEDSTASLTWSSVSVQFLAMVILIPRHYDPGREGRQLHSLFLGGVFAIWVQ